jgi:hypothetical protein
MSRQSVQNIVILVAILISPAFAFGQEAMQASVTPMVPSWLPRPVLFGGPSLVGNGYQSIAANFGGGVLLNSRKLVGDFEARYMDARKTNDGTVNNRKGHERFLDGSIFYPWRKSLYFGGGAQWSETATTNYTKNGWRPVLGLGGDHFAQDWSCRWQVLYVTPMHDRWNALQGPEFQFWLPSPASKSHFFYRQTLGVYEFHTTITDPRDPVLTAQQTSDRHSAAFLDFTLGWKF